MITGIRVNLIVSIKIVRVVIIASAVATACVKAITPIVVTGEASEWSQVAGAPSCHPMYTLAAAAAVTTSHAKRRTTALPNHALRPYFMFSFLSARPE